MPTCPEAGVKPIALSHETGQHTVTLSWRASAVSTSPGSQVVGYCLYRSKTQNAAKKNPTCSNCEQVNSVAFPGTGCVDDLVKDGATYYYVVTAANAQGKISSSSNEALAQIPATKERAKTVVADPYPLCRAK